MAVCLAHGTGQSRFVQPSSASERLLAKDLAICCGPHAVPLRQVDERSGTCIETVVPYGYLLVQLPADTVALSGCIALQAHINRAPRPNRMTTRATIGPMMGMALRMT